MVAISAMIRILTTLSVVSGRIMKRTVTGSTDTMVSDTTSFIQNSVENPAIEALDLIETNQLTTSIDRKGGGKQAQSQSQSQSQSGGGKQSQSESQYLSLPCIKEGEKCQVTGYAGCCHACSTNQDMCCIAPGIENWSNY